MKHRIVVLGAGYAGLPAAQRLARQVRPDEVEVTLVSAAPDFVERPRLHQLAVGQQLPDRSLAKLLEGTSVELTLGTVIGLDPAGRRVAIGSGPDGSARQAIGYDTLVYALGSNIDLTSVPGVAEHTSSLTGRDAAFGLRSRLPDLAAAHGTVVVAGGGLTGIETAAELAESFPGLRVQLVSGRAPGSHLSGKAQAYLGDAFAALGVDVVAGVHIAEVRAEALVIDGGGELPFDACVWAGGFSVPQLARACGLEVDAAGRARVDANLRSLSHPDIYVIGDAAAVSGPWGSELSMGCRTGGFTGPQVADAIAARLTGREPKPFKFRYFHECISLGRRRGVVQFLNADELPKNRVLTGRAAIAYKNMTLNGAQLLFRHPGPYLARRRRLDTTARTTLAAA
ncbi:MAG: dehydrogenase, FAD-containing subunit [Mycobacterium sp.]|nr:dehydrogenase, FAD-containing subunit [Mycobacterium sp.]